MAKKYVPVAERRRRQAEKEARRQSEAGTEVVQATEAPEVETPNTDAPPKRVWVKAERKPGKRDFADTKDPDLHARLVRDTPKRVNHFKRQGYVVAHASEIAEHDGLVVEDKTVHHGDRVVMITRKDWVEEREAERQAEMRSMVSRHDDSLREDFARETGRDLDIYEEDRSPGSRGRKFYSVPR